MKKIYVSPNPTKDSGFKITKEICDLLRYIDMEILLPDACGEIYSYAKYFPACPPDADLIVVVGGDGSFIDASQDAIKYDIPIIGVNLGKVGYLSEIPPSELDTLKKLVLGEYEIVEKILLETSFGVSGEENCSVRLAVNDVVISHTSYLGISDFVIYSNEGGIRYRADGVVIATPAGSTAYSLSSGGPIVSHNADAIIVTPIAPHSFFNRSIVFGADDCIKLKNTGSESLNISVDGRFIGKVAPNEKCRVCTSKKKIKVMTFKENNMFSNLFSKMQILEDVL